ncbi:MAG: heparan-alpha-glucosaminide N-acetyltransferase domain-containing protein [Acidobacteriaceae bacterium]
MSSTATATLNTAPALEVTRPARILSVDMLRGITIALMILVNDPGDWGHTFSQLDHSPWNGWTLTDVVFPMFLFLVGASTVFSLEARERKGDCKKTLAGHIFWRALKLFLLKTALSLIPLFHWHTMRIYGVLTRIALCYLLAGLLLLTTRRVRVLLAIVAVLLVGYWVLLRWVSVPGAGMPVRDFPLLDRVQNLTAWMDRGFSAWTLKWLHTGALYLKTSDPEGGLSTLPALATTLLGAVAGLLMRRPEWAEGAAKRNAMRNGMIAFGGLLFLGGSVWARWFPVNKNLWTSTFVLVMAGISMVLLALFNWLVDGRAKPWPKWLEWATWPWFMFGANAIAAYTTSVVLVKTFSTIKIATADGHQRSLWSLAYEHGFARGHSTEWTSLAFAVTFVAICFLPNWWLWRKKIFWKI